MEKLILVKTLSELEALEDYLQDKDFIAVDTETTGLTLDDEIIGFSVSAEPNVGYYVVISYWDVPTQKLVYLETMEEAAKFMQGLVGKPLLMHNAVFDCQMINNCYGVELMPSVFADTMIMAHLLDENRSCGLKELALSVYGETADVEQKEMKESVSRNGGVLTKNKYELYKADADLIGRYGAKDTILTYNLFFHFDPLLHEAGLDKFFYDDESMPLLRGPTYDLNTAGLRVDPEKLQNLKGTLEVEIAEAQAFIHSEIKEYVKDKYPGTGKATTFNIGANQQLSWLLFDKLEEDFHLLTDSGKEICKFLGLKLPYALKDKKIFIKTVLESKGMVYKKAGTWNPKTKTKLKTDAKIGDYWKYLAAGKITMGLFSTKYKWVGKLLEHNKNTKLLSTYVLPILEKSGNSSNIIRPSFLQHGTTSGRYSSRHPNFQNLPRDDKRVKACIISRPGTVFVGADQAQLEPRVFASVSQDTTLMASFTKGEDFYSVVGAPVYDKTGCSLHKNDPNSFAVRYPKLRDGAKVIALSTPYGRTVGQMAAQMDIPRDEAKELIDNYFTAYPNVEAMMLESHEQAKRAGVVHSLFGRPRRIPAAMDIPKGVDHSDLDYASRTLLNLAMNHRVQSTAASIMNRAAVAFKTRCSDLGWENTVKIVMQVHDELIVECPIELAEEVALVLKWAMEETVTLPGVVLLAEPKISNDIAGLK